LFQKVGREVKEGKSSFITEALRLKEKKFFFNIVIFRK